MSIRIITRADDLGSFLSATPAILETCEQGCCRNVSVLAGAPALAQAAKAMAGRSDICFGLHAAISCEWDHPRWGPCADPARVPALLAEDGGLVANPGIVHSRGVPTEQILLELQAQLDRLRELGFDIRYMDTHMPWDWLYELGCEDQRLESMLSQWSRARGLIYWQQAPVKKLPRSEQTTDWNALVDDGLYLWVGHPCYDDEEMRRVVPAGGQAGEVGTQRDQQRLAFVQATTLAEIERRGIRCIRYDEW
jgi:chitin disaccharide deacetylase